MTATRGRRGDAGGSFTIFEPGSEWPKTYLYTLMAFTVANAAIFVLDATVWLGGVKAVTLYNGLVEYFGGAAPFSLLKAALVSETWRLVMLLSERIRMRIRESGREEGREEERRRNAEEQLRNTEELNRWYARLQQAQDKGVEFSEPPPWEKP